MGDGTKENPYTREDVLRLIEENGGTAKGLDLSAKTFKDGINLRGLNLEGIILKGAILWDIELEDPERDDLTVGLEGAHLEGASLMSAHLEEAHIFGSHLEGADLFNANLEGALLTGAHLEESNLTVAHLEGAKMRGAHLEGALLPGVRLSSATLLQDVDWGNYILREEKEGEAERGEESRVWFNIAADTYRRLKMWYTNAGVYDIAAKFYYREMEAKRKAQSWKSEPISKLWLWVIKLLCGYGEKPWRVVVWGISVLFGSALLYFFLRGVAPHTLTLQAFLASLYYSAVSFTALGYGPWFNASSVRSWAQGVGAAEAIIGVFTIALFLVTFVKKMTR